MRIGDVIKSLRLERGLTQKDLGQKTGVSELSIRCWENGTKNPSVGALLTLSEVFKVPTDYLLGISGRYNTDEFILNAKSLRDAMLSKESEVLHDIVDAAQSAIKFACFSEEIKSPTMWGQYADNEEGFALQYDFTKQVSPNEISDSRILKSIQTYPIIYNKDRFHVPHEYVMYLFKYRMTYVLAGMYGSHFPYSDFRSILPAINPCPDEAMVTKIMLHKSMEWKNEKEWRVICNSADPEYQQAEYGYFKKAPTAVYLGRRMKQNSRKLLIDIARKKGIPVYEMLINDDSPRYLLKVKRLTK